MAHTKEFEHLKIELEAIKLATNNFADESCIGSGGFGKVYKGRIDAMVAFKRLDRAFGQGGPEFWKEIMMLSLYKHENIVSLVGFCDDHREKILVYEYVPNKSLDLYLNSDRLTWIARLKICIGAACGLVYLHNPDGTQQRVLHRDIKSSNILLDEDMNAKIADFGLSKFGPANQEYTFLISNAVGTPGYVDPLYAENGYLTKESDVYSFGVVLFEVLCGRLCIDYKKVNKPLVGLARKSYEQNTINEIVFGNIKDEINPNSLQVFATIAYQCLKRDREERPLMSDVLSALLTAFQYQCPINPSRAGSIPQGNVLTAMEVKRRTGILNVKVIEGIDVSRTNPFAACNPYVILRLTHTDLQSMKKTTVKHKKPRNPVWNEEFSLNVENIDVQTLVIKVMSEQSVDKHDYLGRSEIKLKNLPEYPKDHNVLVTTKHNGFHVCNLKLETVYKPLAYSQPVVNEYLRAMQKAAVENPNGRGLLVVIIHEARYLANQNIYPANRNPFFPLRKPSSYVSLQFNDELRKTKTIKDDFCPEWKEEFTFMLDRPPRDDKLRLEVFTTPWSILDFILADIRYGLKEPMGCVDIDLVHVVDEKRIIDTYYLAFGGQLDVELQWKISD